MNWIKFVEDVLLVQMPQTVEVLGKEWLFDEAKLAHDNATAPFGASPVAAMLLSLAEQKKSGSLSQIEKIFAKAKELNSKRISEFTSNAALSAGTAWQGLAELSLLERLASDGQFVAYDKTRYGVSTPDFRRQIAGEDCAIEHVAVSEGQHMKQQKRGAHESLKRAHRTAGILDEAKDFVESYPDSVPPLTEKELVDVALSTTGRERKAGMPDPVATPEEVMRATKSHQMEQVRSYSAMPFVVSRFQSVEQEIDYLRKIKEDGVQVADAKWKILALSLPDVFYNGRNLEKLNQYVQKDDPSLIRLQSGEVWHALLGKKGERFFYGSYEHHIQQKIYRFSHELEADGLLVDASQPWHAVIVSIFQTTWHHLESPSSNRSGGDILPLSLAPFRVLFLRTEGGESLPERVVDELKSLLDIKKVIKS